jgi:hypothetical protein
LGPRALAGDPSKSGEGVGMIGLGCLEATHSESLAIDTVCSSPRIEQREIPPTLGSRKWLSVNNQGPYNSCCGNAVDKALEWSRWAGMDYRDRPEDLSARFSYLAGQDWAGVIGRGDNGLSIEAGVMAAADIGAVLEDDCPYWQEGERIDGSIGAWRSKAGLHRVRSVSRVVSVDEVVQALGQGIAATVFGMGWKSGHANYRGGVLTRDPGGMRLGGHAVCAVDYQQGGEVIEIQNSHGEGFGDGGRMLVSAEYFAQLLAEPFGAFLVSGVLGFFPRRYRFQGFMA